MSAAILDFAFGGHIRRGKLLLKVQFPLTAFGEAPQG